MNRARRLLFQKIAAFVGFAYLAQKAKALEALDTKEKNYLNQPPDDILLKLKESQTEPKLYAIKDKWP